MNRSMYIKHTSALYKHQMQIFGDRLDVAPAAHIGRSVYTAGFNSSNPVFRNQGTLACVRQVPAYLVLIVEQTILSL